MGDCGVGREGGWGRDRRSVNKIGKEKREDKKLPLVSSINFRFL